jgi:hypothetical protein
MGIIDRLGGNVGDALRVIGARVAPPLQDYIHDRQLQERDVCRVMRRD